MIAPAADPHAPTSCLARWEQGSLTLGNALFTEVWRMEPEGTLRLASFRRTAGPEWIDPAPPRRPGPGADPLSAPEETAAGASPWTAELTEEAGERGATQVTLQLSAPDGRSWRRHSFRIYPTVAGSLHHTSGPEIDRALEDLQAGAITELTGRLKTKDNGQMFARLPSIAPPLFALAHRHLRVRDVSFVDQSDHHSNLVFEREYLTHPGERCLPLRTNLLCIEDPDTGEGFLWLLLAPLPAVRAGWSPYFDFLLAFQEGRLVAGTCPAGYALARLAYAGGRTGATCALHALQRVQYECGGGRSGLVLSNTWGDRAGASHLSEAFVRAEIAAAARLGVEVVQVDDGWQKGATVNTTLSGGVWNGFWAADPEFWTPHPGRFPRGLRPLADAAREAGVALGLWYAPDSAGDLANWERDARRILELWRENGIAFFKLDAVKLHSRLAETRFHALCDRVQAESGGGIFFDFDATAEHRPTYWGRAGGGALFLENRFTEQAGYHPHQTLRSLWSLAHFVRPERLRIEFLNPMRNPGDYGDDPLRPASYPPEYLLAVTLPASPLAWMELSKVPADVAAAWQRLLATWKPHRRAFHAGTVLPVGSPPDGFSWTGFVSLSATGASGGMYGLFFRERARAGTALFDLPTSLPWPAAMTFRTLAGSGAVTLAGPHRVQVEIPTCQDFVLVHGSTPSAGKFM
jgi:alpha-galactosidase